MNNNNDNINTKCHYTVSAKAKCHIYRVRSVHRSIVVVSRWSDCTLDSSQSGLEWCSPG